jgi:hypothetical protein
MGGFSDFLEDELLDHVLKTGDYAVPTHIYVALWVGDPLDTGAGGAEVSGGSYARVVCDTWDAAAARATENTGAVTFAEATGAWGTVTHFAIFDAITGGNFLAHGTLAASKTIGSGDNAEFAAGDLDISVDSGAFSDFLADALLDHIFKTTPYASPTNIYVALCDTTIVDATTGTTISEPSGGSYARKQHEAYDVSSGGASENTGAITFVQATASWGTITDVCLCDALTVGNMLIYSKAIGNLDVAEWAAGAFDITLT